MGLKLEKGLKHQTEAVDRINKVFENVPILNNTLKYANPIINLNSSNLLNNIKELNNELPSSLKGNVDVGDYLNIDINDTIAIGDNYNDVSMIKEAGLGACVSCAHDDIKEISDYVCEKNFDEGAVKEVIETFVLKGA